MKTIIAARDGKIILTIPNPTIKPDGTIWRDGVPLLGITDDVAKAKAIVSVKTKCFADIPAEYYTRLGDNKNGLWAGTREDWANTPAGQTETDAEQARAEQAQKMVSIHLSSRGWGDYSNLEWHGDITRPDADILAECRLALDNGHDVDTPNQSDDEILSLIHKARASWDGKPERIAAAKKAEAEDIKHKIATGYCFACETWCHGDCGHYSTDPKIKLLRDIKAAQAEANYGITEG